MICFPKHTFLTMVYYVHGCVWLCVLLPCRYRFIRAHWSRPVPWLAQRWAVLENFAMPILGEGEAQPNDTFVAQLKMNAEAAVAEVCRRGVATRGQIAVGGHSYGAFMTAHLLAHTDLFQAGICRSGAYNRT